MALIDNLNDDEKNKLAEYLKALTLFNETEQAAYLGIIPMTQEIYNSCIDKCMGRNIDSILFHLMDTYPDFIEGYGKLLDKRFGPL